MADISLDYQSLADRMKAVPVAVRDYFYSEEMSAAREEIYDKHNLPDEDRSVCFVTEMQVLLREISLGQFPNELWNRLDWEDSREEAAVALIADLLGHIMLPLSAFIGDVIGLLHELGADPNNYPNKTIEKRVVSYEQALDEITDSLNLDDMSVKDKKRLRYIIESRLREVRDEAETKRMLTKPAKVGGLEMSDVQAGEIIKLVEDERNLTRYTEEKVDIVATDEGVQAQPSFTAEEIKKIFAGPVGEQKAIAKQLEAVSERGGGNGDILREEMHDIMYPDALEVISKEQIIATLLLFARQGELVPTLIDDERYRDVIRAYYEQVGQPMSEAISNEPAGPAAMNAFLQIVLRGIAQLSPADAARYGLRVINALKKKGESQYVELIAFDMDRGEFVWTQPINF